MFSKTYFYSMMIFFGFLLVLVGVFVLIDKIRKAWVKRLLKKNPDVSTIYCTVNNYQGQYQDVEITKANGRKCHKFLYLRIHGVYLLPGTYNLTLELSGASEGAAKYEKQGTATLDVTIEPAKRYALLFEAGGHAYSLAELPSAEDVDEVALLTYIDEKKKNGENITAETVQNLNIRYK